MDKTTVFNAEARLNTPLVGAVRLLWSEVWSHRWHIYVAFQRDFRMLSNFTRLSAVWNFVMPLVPISVYVLLMGLRMFPSFDGVSATVYVASGVTLWFLFAGLVQRPVAIIENNVKAVAKTGFPLIGAVLAGFGQLAFDTLVRSVAVVLLVFIFHGMPSWKIIFVPILMAFAVVLFAGAGLILSMLNMAVRDVSKLVGIAMQYGIFLSSVIFPLDKIAALKTILKFNPFYVFIENCRSLALRGELADFWPLATWSLLGIVVALIACRLFYVLELRLRGLA